MIIGIPKETKTGEVRVSLIPKYVRILVKVGHTVYVESKAGAGVGYSDEDYIEVGAKITTADEIYSKAGMIVKFRSPTDNEFKKIKDTILFSMLHAQQNPKYMRYIKENNIGAVAMESLMNDFDERYIDATDITGEVGVLYATRFLDKMPQEASGRVGSGAITMCNRLGIKVKILRKSEYKDIAHFMKGKDILINSIAWPEEERKNKNYLVTKDMLKLLNNDAIVLDLSVDYPNPIETCKPTTLKQPWFKVSNVTHISIYGYPGLVPVSSVKRYSPQIMPLVLEIANNGGLEGLEKVSDMGRHIKNASIILSEESKNIVEQVSSDEDVKLAYGK